MCPETILFDEPDSAHDSQLVGEVLDVLLALKQTDMTVMMPTHDMGLARQAVDNACFLSAERNFETGSADGPCGAPHHLATKAFWTKPLKQDLAALLFKPNSL